MSPDIWILYEMMLKSRLFEEAIAKLWHDGLISGEMHLGTGEEAIIAGVVAHLRDGDAMALDHRGTAPLLMRGVDPVAILHEVLGHPEGLCGGMGGHMHLYSKAYLAASSGIVGAGGPAAAGFALAAQVLRPGTVAVSFFGEGAMDQGMLMESMNLASVWNLPVLFVCKDDGWAITTQPTKGLNQKLHEKARGLGLPVVEADGLDVLAVWEAAQSALELIRAGEGPVFLHVRCVHLEAHFLGFQLVRIVRDPLRELPRIAIPLTQSFLKPGGAPLGERLAGLKIILAAVLSTLRDPRRDPAFDPVTRARISLQAYPEQLQALEKETEQEITQILAETFAEVTP